MATIRKQGIDPNLPIRDHVGEDKSFGRASLLQPRPRKPGLNPLTTAVDCEDTALEKDVAMVMPVSLAPIHTRH